MAYNINKNNKKTEKRMSTKPFYFHVSHLGALDYQHRIQHVNMLVISRPDIEFVLRRALETPTYVSEDVYKYVVFSLFS